jgi:hypothetical protein
MRTTPTPLSSAFIGNEFHCLLLPSAVTFGFVLLHHRASGHRLCAIAIAARPLGTFLNVFVFALFFCANTAQMCLSWHEVPFDVLSAP